MLRLAGLAGADPDGVPWVNHLVDAVRAEVGLEHGVARPVWDALRRGEAPDLLTLAQKAAGGIGRRSACPRAARPPPPARAARRGWAAASARSTAARRSATG